MKLITYNIRYDFPDDKNDNWHHRKEAIVKAIQEEDPDIFCLQEVLYEPYQYLQENFQDHYDFYGIARDDGKKEGEFNPIFYKKERFKPIDKACYWLSKTPKTPSKNWNSGCFRIMTYLLLEDRYHKQQYLIVNTHLDNASKEARKNQAQVLIDLIKKIPIQENTAIILCGDMNSQPQEEAIQKIRKYFDQAEDIAHKQKGPQVTFNGFKHHANFDEMIKIDYFFSKNIPEIQQFETHVHQNNQRYISDHFMLSILL